MRLRYAEATIGPEERAAVSAMLEAGWLGEGQYVAQFERAFCELTGKKHAVAVNSGSSANFLALAWIARVKGRSGEVITPACTFNTVAAPIIQHGFTPVFVDVAPGLYVARAEQIAKAITDQTVAVVIPHLLGNVAEIDYIRGVCDVHDVLLLEDCCDALGSTYHHNHVGCWGDLASFSFYASHQITAFGGGGMVVTNDEDAATFMRKVRDWGRGDVYPTGAAEAETEDIARRFSARLGDWEYDRKFLYEEWGFNFKMIEAEAAFGHAQFLKLAVFTEQRRQNYWNLYDGLSEMLDVIQLPEVIEHANPAWLAYPVLLRDSCPVSRGTVVTRLEQAGVQTRMIMAGNITRHPAMEKVPSWIAKGSLSGCDTIARQGFLVGCHQGMGEAECAELVARIGEAVRA